MARATAWPTLIRIIQLTGTAQKTLSVTFNTRQTDRQHAYDVTLRLVRVTIIAVKNQ